MTKPFQRKGQGLTFKLKEFQELFSDLSAKVLDQTQRGQANPNAGEAILYGIDLDDSHYDYTQHIRPIGEGTFIPTIRRQMRLNEKMEIRKERPPLPEPIEDPEVLQTLEALGDEAFVNDDEFNDDFISLLNYEPEPPRYEHTLDMEFKRLLHTEYAARGDSSECEAGEQQIEPPQPNLSLEQVRSTLRARDFFPREETSSAASESEESSGEPVRRTLIREISKPSSGSCRNRPRLI